MSLPQIEGLELRYTVAEDAEALKQWLLEPGVLKGFPMQDELEVDDSVKHWIGFARYKSSLTATYKGKPVGMVTLCLMPYKKLTHQALLSIIVAGEMRDKGVGTVLMNNLIHLAKNYFGIEVLYLEVYEGNRAISLYRRFGFTEIGRQRHFMKENGSYVAKIIMERVL
ncbi:MAG: GNAT family N-acetyltransferase [Verrucomicrobia bacterium]|nr:GNAT family N-acetyltransferase [Verrucomicrobiota bacterium]MBS0646535.1 GNAT family N-acetyltransferase [Verrucomicrobiota bacterium]